MQLNISMLQFECFVFSFFLSQCFSMRIVSVQCVVRELSCGRVWVRGEHSLMVFQLQRVKEKRRWNKWQTKQNRIWNFALSYCDITHFWVITFLYQWFVLKHPVLVLILMLWFSPHAVGVAYLKPLWKKNQYSFSLFFFFIIFPF